MFLRVDIESLQICSLMRAKIMDDSFNAEFIIFFFFCILENISLI